MNKKFYILFCIAMITLAFKGQGQCTTLGQNPSTAFPVCGITIFKQLDVPFCNLGNIAVAGCGGGTRYQIKNPFWYKFTCYQSGTLGFLISPLAANEDYDWQLYDVTGRDPEEVINNQSLVVTGNWAGTYGNTGASASGVTKIECGSNPSANKPTFARMPDLIAGHNYLLMISHFSDTRSGYDLSFGGGSAVITDPKDPHLGEATAICDGISAMIRTNKRMKCNSLLGNGSEFSISPNVTTVIAAAAIGCENSFDFDSVRLTFAAPLPPGNYTIRINKGADGNTLVDNCDKIIPDGETIPMIVYPLIPTPMDSLTKPGCAPDVIRLVFRKGIKCNSIAADGSDFAISGTTPVAVTGANGICNGNGLSRVIEVKLSTPIQVKGSYTLTLVTGSDGNAVIDECSQETPAGAMLNFTTKDTVNADFSYVARLGCVRDTVEYLHVGRNEVNYWKWNFDSLRTSLLQNPRVLYTSFGLKHTQLIVSNGVCRDTSAIVPVMLDNVLQAAFEATAVVCPTDLAVFVDKSIGNGLSWSWDFANNNTSTLQVPPMQAYLPSSDTRDVLARLVIKNNIGCMDTSYQKITVASHCYIAVPNAFTPNGDGMNDFLYPINAYKAINLLFRVYNRFGQLMFETKDWTRKWDGSYRGQGADPGTYVWTLHYTNIDTGKFIEQKGTSILIRQ